jgi:adenine-specific DNA-methyltransferase
MSSLLCDFWSDINTGKLFNEGGVEFSNGKKPEFLIARIFNLFTEKNELVLDCFGGSGSTFAVAQKMNRKWIGIEIGNHADTHIIPRLNNVLVNDNKGGISEVENWSGGGDFKYFHLGESIINIDKKTGKGEFNWSLGKQFIQESLLVSYDFVVQKNIDVFPAQIFKDDNNPTIGKIIGKNGKSIYGIAFLVAPGEIALTITNEDIKTIYNVIRKQEDFQSLVIYTNKGIDIAQDAIPENLDIIKVPHAIFAELER